jgi:heat shock protein HtpX
LAIPLELLMLFCSNVALWIALGINLLVMRQSQRAEFLADALATSVSGSDPMQTALKKTDLDEVLHEAFIKMAMLRSSESLKDIVQTAATQSPEVMESIAQRSRKEGWRVDATHPPTASRIELIARQRQTLPVVKLSAVERQAFEAELQRLAVPIQRELMNTYREIAFPS